jgi:hypothetical protein
MLRLVVATDPETVEINYTWLPTWLGLNEQLLRKLADRIRPVVVGRPLDDATLALAECTLIMLLMDEFSYIEGLEEVLRSVHNVKIMDKR